MRVLLSTDYPCKGGCKYCFAKWGSYKPLNNSMLEGLNADTESLLLYPCCDGDCFAQVELVKRIAQLSTDFQKVYVSISSKTLPSDEQITQWYGLHQKLVSAKKGFLKYAISISNRSMLHEIEPDTMSYAERLNLAHIIKEKEIPISLTLKPILPFISKEEYYSVLSDFFSYTNKVLIGGLYVEKSSDFYTHYLSEFISTKRKVGWIPDNPEWDYIEDPVLIEQIKKYAEQLGMQVYFSDRDLVKSITEEYL